MVDMISFIVGCGDDLLMYGGFFTFDWFMRGFFDYWGIELRIISFAYITNIQIYINTQYVRSAQKLLCPLLLILM